MVGSRFDTCFEIVLKNEGGLANERADKGGRTNFGVTQKRYDAYRQSRKLELRSVEQITLEEVKDIYSDYWRDAKCAYLPPQLDLLVFDASINHGVNRAIKLLQRTLGVTEDGVVGRETLEALNEEIAAGNLEDIEQLYLVERERFYDNIVKSTPSQAVFIRGWMNRVDNLRKYLA